MQKSIAALTGSNWGEPLAFRAGINGNRTQASMQPHCCLSMCCRFFEAWTLTTFPGEPLWLMVVLFN